MKALAMAGALLLASGAARADAPAYSPVPPAVATEGASHFTAPQRAEIVAILRQALKSDPSILRDAVEALRDADARSEAADQASAIASHRAELLTGDVVAGDSSGDVTLTEFYDPRCPYCRKMLPTVDATIAADRHLRVVFRLIPILGADSVVEAKAILAAARQGRYTALQEALMTSGAPPTDANLAKAARSVGVDPVRLERDMADPAITKQLQASIALARTLGADGTPTFVVGGTMIPGMVDAAALRKAIADARS